LDFKLKDVLEYLNWQKFHLQKYGEKYGFPVGAPDDVPGLALAYGKHFAENEETEGALYCFNIAYELTGDENIKKIIDDLSK
jgi:hypothetical protein